MPKNTIRKAKNNTAPSYIQPLFSFILNAQIQPKYMYKCAEICKTPCNSY